MYDSRIFFACIAAIPIAIKYAKSKEGYVAEAQIPAPAEKVYRAALTLAEERAPVVKILNRDDSKLLIEVTDDIQRASFKAEAINPETTQGLSNITDITMLIPGLNVAGD